MLVPIKLIQTQNEVELVRLSLTVSVLPLSQRYALFPWYQQLPPAVEQE